MRSSPGASASHSGGGGLLGLLRCLPQVRVRDHPEQAGEGAARDGLGRIYTYYAEAEIRGLMTATGFTGITSESEPSTGFDGTPCTSMHIFARRA